MCVKQSSEQFFFFFFFILFFFLFYFFFSGQNVNYFETFVDVYVFFPFGYIFYLYCFYELWNEIIIYSGLLVTIFYISLIIHCLVFRRDLWLFNVRFKNISQIWKNKVLNIVMKTCCLFVCALQVVYHYNLKNVVTIFDWLR